MGKTIVFTGVHKGLEEQVSMMGGKVAGSVSGNTDLLIVKDNNFTSSKVNKARDIGTPIMTADDFKKMYL
jgi:DNA ligase (NAD+)